ncbi:MAG TPA: PhzF family phenazine biosynthesis protein [Cellulomonas sp.]
MRYTEVDVFTDTLTAGNPVAVVHGADGLDDATMAAFARWTNLSETTFLVSPTDPAADYRLRIFTPGGELPFAGHPTLGSARAWVAAGGVPRTPGVAVQECGVGLVRVRVAGEHVAFAAPPLRRSGPADEATRELVVRSLRVDPQAVRAVEWVDNGPGWVAALLASADEVLALDPDLAAMGGRSVGAVGPFADRGEADVEVRAFVPGLGVPEDPVTGSLAAGLGLWLPTTGLVGADFVIRQGTALGRRGMVHVTREDGVVWIGGDTVLAVMGTVALEP